MAVDWGYFDKFDNITDKYLPARGEGETMAEQAVTAVCKLIYKWYNDGDVYDNVHNSMCGWCNDLSSYANWLAQYASQYAPTENILMQVYDCWGDDDYETILQELAVAVLNDNVLDRMHMQAKMGSIYKCEGAFEYAEQDEDDWF